MRQAGGTFKENHGRVALHLILLVNARYAAYKTTLFQWLWELFGDELYPAGTQKSAAMEIKVQCDCGQRYKFDVEPLLGQMPYRVNCPVCGADGTEKANALIRETVGVQSAPIPVARPVSAAPGRLRISPPPPVATAAPVVPGPPPVSTEPLTSAPVREVKKASDQMLFLRGLSGAILGGFIGMMLWFYLIKWTGYEIGYAAWGVGLLAGLGARVLGKQGSTMLGVVCGLCALVAILGGEFLAAKSFADKEIDDMADEAYRARLAYAQSASKAQTDEEVRALLANENEVEAAEVTAEEIKDFRENELQELRDLANGKPSKVEYEAQFKKIKDSFIYQLLVLKESVGAFTLLWLFLGIASAYKLGADSD